jgi:hypothetical protein
MLVDSKSASECRSVENVVQVEPVGEFDASGGRWPRTMCWPPHSLERDVK